VRHHLITLLLLLPAAALAEPAAKHLASDKPQAIDPKPMAAQLDVYKDDLGGYYVTPSLGQGGDDRDKWVFFGDGKTMYQQRVIGGGSSGDGQDWSLWAPRVKGITYGSIELQKGVATVHCREKDPRALKKLTADEAKTFFKAAQFLPPLWRRSAHFLARDDDGTYYYVDQLLEDYGGKGFRVYVGQKGAMKELPLTNSVSDSAGEIFATKTGELKIVTSSDGKAYWKKGGKKVDLVVLDPFPNRYLIYRDLGIYGQLGAICDDQ
jgi:hypothetical protein